MISKMKYRNELSKLIIETNLINMCKHECKNIFQCNVTSLIHIFIVQINERIAFEHRRGNKWFQSIH